MNISEWSGDGWTVSVTGAGMTLTHAPGSVAIASADAARLEVRRRWFRWSLCHDGQRLVGLRGITRTEADALSRAVRRLALAPAIADALAWHAAVAKILAEARTGCSCSCTGRSTTSGRNGSPPNAASISRTCWSRRPATSKPGPSTPAST